MEYNAPTSSPTTSSQSSSNGASQRGVTAVAKKKKTVPRTRSKKNPLKPPEPKGGPFARREAFVQERLGKLEPRDSSERGRRDLADTPDTPAKQRPEADFRRQRIEEYRR